MSVLICVLVGVRELAGVCGVRTSGSCRRWWRRPAGLGLVKFWLMPWLGYHFWMSTFTVTHEAPVNLSTMLGTYLSARCPSLLA